ncbi:hypothetical protein [Spirilliplanes yamanashiensis]|uniref:Alpha/beta hydrolase n=1 Tax=Spirilliplanes yamanashiensis TaxID=42233 RepID=A0A8J4DGV6_9ACTN|nr:hypothetical protein [Spirilliplanes yamanashiensis]MDP9819774.1 hypothetical protein [Spirilliplanes yamanashiensis]GIJ01406.1 hypothetical protein Sya03_07580 [Spirilliplanes yamanashiensis]
MLVALLPSPFLPPAAWEPVAAALRARGHRVTVPTLPTPAAPATLAAGLTAALPATEPLTLVPHSNAGLYVPGLCTTHRVAAAIFVDALLPPGAGPAPVAPPTFLAHLRGLATPDGLLPPWTTWWDAADIAPLFPSPAALATLRAAEPRVPLSYVEGTVDVPAGWASGVRGAYLAFGDAYADERATAGELGWPVVTIPDAGHLHVLMAPETVADHIAAWL